MIIIYFQSFRLEKLAEAGKNRLNLEAEAEAEAIKVKGEAEAYAVTKKAEAEAIAMQQKAEAYKEYKDAAMMETYLSVMPKVCYVRMILVLPAEL